MEFLNQKKNIFFLLRLVEPVLDPVKILKGMRGYIWYIKDISAFNRTARKKIKFNSNLYPILNERTGFTPFDGHYFYQQLWTFEQILKNKPKEHIDIGSTYEMSGYISKITRAKFIDLRPIKASLKNFIIERGNILHLKYPDNSIKSLSCLHVAEHIGLGRYGDPIDPDGTKKACSELARVLSKEGFLYFSAPIGKERLCFNAHRIHDPRTILKYFRSLKLISFSAVDDKGNFYEDVNPKDYQDMDYGCGLFLFTK